MRPLIALAVLSASCGPTLSTPVASTQFAQYQYTVALPTKPLSPNEQLHLVWEPRLAAGSSPVISDLQLCVAWFGPFDTVEALKTAMSASRAKPSCPPTGAVIASETMRTTSNSGVRFAADVIVPSAIGFYDVDQISIWSGVGGTSSTSSGGIIEVRKTE